LRGGYEADSGAPTVRHMTPKKHDAYVAIWNATEGKRNKGFAISAERETLRTSPGDAAEKAEDTEEAKAQSDEPKGRDGSLADTIGRIVESSHSQTELLYLSSFLVEGFPGMMIQRDVVSLVEKSGEPLETVDGAAIYGLSSKELQQIFTQMDRVRRIETGLKSLPAALLMSIVATFDTNISDVIRDMLTLKTEIFQTGDRTILLSDALQAESIAELREKSIADEIYTFSRGSHEDQVKYIESNFHVGIKDHWKRWPDFIEVFERRNLIAHGEKTFTKRYASICSKNGHKGSEKILGTPVKLTSIYLRQAADILLEFSLLLVFSLWRKQFAQEEQNAFDSLNQAAFKLIETKKYEVAIRILDYALGLKNTRAEDRTRKMMYVNLASAHRHSKNDELSLRVLSDIDWSGSSDDFKICVAALRGNIEEVIKLMPIVTNSKAISKDSFRRWPVFDFIRDKEEFLAKFREIFDEPLRQDDPLKTVEFSEDNTEPTTPIGQEAITIH
jgi:hypothetical protein